MRKQLLKLTNKSAKHTNSLHLFDHMAQSWAQSCDKWMMFPPPPLWCGVWWFCAASAVHSNHMVPNQTKLDPNESEFAQTNKKRQNLQTVYTLLVTWAQSWDKWPGSHDNGPPALGRQGLGLGTIPWGGGRERQAADHIYIYIYIYIYI